MELVENEGSNCSPASHKPKRVHERWLAKPMSSSDLSSEYTLESDSDSEEDNVASSKGSKSE